MSVCRDGGKKPTISPLLVDIRDLSGGHAGHIQIFISLWAIATSHGTLVEQINSGIVSIIEVKPKGGMTERIIWNYEVNLCF